MIEGASLARVEVVNLSLKSQLQTLDLKASIKFDTKDPAAIAKAFRSAVEKVLKGRRGNWLWQCGTFVADTGWSCADVYKGLFGLPSRCRRCQLSQHRRRPQPSHPNRHRLHHRQLHPLCHRRLHPNQRHRRRWHPQILPAPSHHLLPSQHHHRSLWRSPKNLCHRHGSRHHPNHKSRIGLQTSINMRLENSTEAADALAGSLTLIGGNTSDSEVSFGDIAILKTGRTPYEWTKKLFDGNVLSITFLVASSPPLVSLTSSLKHDHPPIDIKRMDVSQLKM
ncbi:hypothetical protein BC829DRAFT_169042 [Chytridium lagenaria]|nr:hypothetical protein BC829DRAFT_169042 [Chytridium lagenaria]